MLGLIQCMIKLAFSFSVPLQKIKTSALSNELYYWQKVKPYSNTRTYHLLLTLAHEN